VLPDSNMWAAYDQHGAGPESRFSGMSSAHGPGFRSHSFGGNGLKTEISSEDVFNAFVGGSVGGGGFGGPSELPFGHDLNRQALTFVQYSPVLV
jgi:DnaJ-class molecular chaperone